MGVALAAHSHSRLHLVLSEPNVGLGVSQASVFQALLVNSTFCRSPIPRQQDGLDLFSFCLSCLVPLPNLVHCLASLLQVPASSSHRLAGTAGTITLSMPSASSQIHNSNFTTGFTNGLGQLWGPWPPLTPSLSGAATPESASFGRSALGECCHCSGWECRQHGFRPASP